LTSGVNILNSLEALQRKWESTLLEELSLKKKIEERIRPSIFKNGMAFLNGKVNLLGL